MPTSFGNLVRSILTCLTLTACTVSAPHYVGLDGDIPDGPADAADARPDGGPDAALDCTLNIASGANADLVLGQTSFTSNTGNVPFESASSLKTVGQIFTNGTRLWASDRGNYRVLQWNSIPIVDAEAASIVIGQASMITHVTGMQSQTLLDGGGPPFSVGDKVLVSDITEHRVLIWNSIPTSNAEAADLVLGQTTFTGNTSGNGAGNFNGPSGIWSDGTRLVVTDVFNNRVLIWNTFPTVNGQAADIVLGWSDFGMSGPALVPPTASSLRSPRGVAFDGTRLYVADSANNRVLIWNSFPTTNGQAADLVIGQGSLTAGNADAGSPEPNAIGLHSPTSIAFGCGNALFIGDELNDRVVIHAALPVANGATADVVLGKPDFTTPSNASTPPSASFMDAATGVAVVGRFLFAADSNRILRFTLQQ